VRKVAKKYFKDVTLAEVKEILQSEVHEERLLALVILVYKYEKGAQKEIYIFYLKNLKYVNNWDLVDTSAPRVIGDYLYNFENKNISTLIKLAKSKNLWKKRVAIVSCLFFIVKGKSAKEILQIAEIVKQDKRDLLQKALGWMLREVYKNVDEGLIRKFLQENIKTVPRTTLRYAIEKMDPLERRLWLAKEF
jgi:3-methyladenine DNA glycosylase AlkD